MIFTEGVNDMSRVIHSRKTKKNAGKSIIPQVFHSFHSPYYY